MKNEFFSVVYAKSLATLSYIVRKLFHAIFAHNNPRNEEMSKKFFF